jgi:hypothetical protein
MESERLEIRHEMAEKGLTILVAVDFSPCSLLALRKAKSMCQRKIGSCPS